MAARPVAMVARESKASAGSMIVIMPSIALRKPRRPASAVAAARSVAWAGVSRRCA